MEAGEVSRPAGGGDWPFYLALGLIGSVYVLLIAGMVVADLLYTSPDDVWAALRSREVRYAIKLSLASCTVTAVLSLWVAIPLGYLLSRLEFPGKAVIDTALDIPIVLPPLVIGLSLLILFQTRPGQWLQDHTFPVTFAVPAVIVAQFAVAAAFAVRTMRVTFDQIDPRQEQVALTLGCTPGQAFWHVALPEARRGVLTAATLAWARSLGEFGPVLIFAGSTRMRTEVLPTTVFLEVTVGRLNAALAVSLIMIAVAAAALILMRVFGVRGRRL